MKNIAKKIEVVANVSIIVAALAFTTVLAKRYFAPVLPLAVPKAAAASIQSGKKADFINVDWGKSDRTLLLVLQAGCHFCSESAPFYQRLARETAQMSGIHIVAVLPQDVAEGSKYLNSLGVPIEDIRQAQLDSLGVSGTPTLILIDG